MTRKQNEVGFIVPCYKPVHLYHSKTVHFIVYPVTNWKGTQTTCQVQVFISGNRKLLHSSCVNQKQRQHKWTYRKRVSWALGLQLGTFRELGVLSVQGTEWGEGRWVCNTQLWNDNKLTRTEKNRWCYICSWKKRWKIWDFSPFLPPTVLPMAHHYWFVDIIHVVHAFINNLICQINSRLLWICWVFYSWWDAVGQRWIPWHILSEEFLLDPSTVCILKEKFSVKASYLAFSSSEAG